ncbi:HAD family hydrolase [Microlunatus flavus]|uniref:HAD family hydrolase n=1 Tax=Microlunatus flavus TaxID=1036181 RepID=UPI00147FF237|nr:HAD hydrolase-like protein [Microlunatus flavus]
MGPPYDTDVEAVCWDWNGTLLDDAAVALTAMNVVLHERALPVLPDVDAYRHVFGFPVQAFYARLGIGDADFRPAAQRYLELFATEVARAPLHDGAGATLSAVGRLGVAQVLISATVPPVLERQMAPHGIARHFDQVLGITDAYAPSKTDVVARWLRSSGHTPERVLMVGDTNHDEEIAEELGVEFVRFARGHQEPPDHDRHPVVRHLRDVVQHVRARAVRSPAEHRPA